MRVVTLAPDGRTDTECYVTVLGGSAGGMLANVNRWLQQIGQQPLSAEAVGALPTIAVLGRSAPLVEAYGTFRGMSGPAQDGAGLVGVVCVLADRTVFVKLTGPAGVLRQERDRFLAFCDSLRVAEGSR
jgi:hypothetical protein